MTDQTFEALRLIDRALLKIMGRQHPGRPVFYALSQAHEAVRKARVIAQPPAGSCAKFPPV